MLKSPGNIDWPLVYNFADLSLDELASYGKAATVAFYGSPPLYSYFNGCSTGGRQVLMLA
ncbi:uncharacterized protein F5Z01DRAFT_660655 [Emericellopsis atlantica]|uniref:Carboxylic ester hydrolase n=1 Tax=Emericellopsis atlantica TaxID=2614577 RepID=A0A9P8CP55_9HYPO|nr:uncharacterized protein F5Z01DRAFT_660655 [Emericellopsis atlantica]KAG9252421.1 hypothetical protein F5Z01DRAFT_660655 [Emericellopsis atlantica]